VTFLKGTNGYNHMYPLIKIDLRNLFYCLQVFTGNVDQTAPVTNQLPEPLTGTTFRLEGVTYYSHACLRWELLGVKGKICGTISK